MESARGACSAGRRAGGNTKVVCIIVIKNIFHTGTERSDCRSALCAGAKHKSYCEASLSCECPRLPVAAVSPQRDRVAENADDRLTMDRTSRSLNCSCRHQGSSERPVASGRASQKTQNADRTQPGRRAGATARVEKRPLLRAACARGRSLRGGRGQSHWPRPWGTSSCTGSTAGAHLRCRT